MRKKIGKNFLRQGTAKLNVAADRWRGWFPLGLAALAQAVWPARARGEDHVDYRYEFYGEENGRIEVNTHSVFFEKKLTDSVVAKGELVYDGISGATPTGAPPPPGKTEVLTQQLTEIRRAGNLGLDWHVGHHTLTPQVAYSDESDYTSVGISLNDAIEFNQKNTTLRLGVAHSFDQVLDNGSPREYRDKDSTDGLIGISQLLSPRTILTADFTYGTANGYLNDPYRVIRFDGYLPGTFTQAEVRPDHRERQVLLLTLTQFITPVNASIETSYRFHHDSYDIFSHTLGLTWNQKLGGRVVISPIFRFYEQSAAFFYYASLPGYEDDPGVPEFRSADYRLSHLYTLTYGVSITARVTDWLSLDAGYQRYDMHGLDSQTSPSAYPKANIFNIGLRLWF